ncbi:hypothetical protein [Cryobacterium sp. Y11]|uniref:hypothetical protein n=1 Tax=Cryobacterium sp. Y11 TaxID=2045016 RepID=UPI001304CED1|nr:hypothetical protein [Cryobacterium sp. Y11]
MTIPAGHRSFLRGCVPRFSDAVAGSLISPEILGTSPLRSLSISLAGRQKNKLSEEKERNAMTYDYENTYPRDRYADGCTCSGCHSEGRVDTQPDEICAVTRYADSNA